jgi:integrase/recombinase XerD
MLEFLKEASLSRKPNTLKRYRVSARKLTPFFEGRTLQEVDKALLMDYRRFRRSGAVSESTINRDETCHGAMFQFAIQNDWIENNPLRRLPKLKEPAPRIRFLSHEEFAKLMSDTLMPSHLRAMIIFAVETGMRYTEQMTLRHDQIDWERKRALLTDTKSGKPRPVPLSELASGQIRVQPRHLQSPYVWVKPDGERYKYIQASWQSLLERRGFDDLKWHDLRKTAGSWWLQAGASMEKVSKILGHGSINVTEKIYAGFRDDDLDEVVSLRAKAGTALTVLAE